MWSIQAYRLRTNAALRVKPRHHHSANESLGKVALNQALKYMTNVSREMNPVEKGHDLRTKIDAIIRYADIIKNDQRPDYAKGKRELSLAHTKLQEAKMWVGKFLEEQGSELPAEFRDNAV